ncbi:hypothetical protein [Marininema halotolerans]|nr:hypothetical protein [Marininema halotolerans]
MKRNGFPPLSGKAANVANESGHMMVDHVSTNGGTAEESALSSLDTWT